MARCGSWTTTGPATLGTASAAGSRRVSRLPRRAAQPRRCCAAWTTRSTRPTEPARDPGPTGARSAVRVDLIPRRSRHPVRSLCVRPRQRRRLLRESRRDTRCLGCLASARWEHHVRAGGRGQCSWPRPRRAGRDDGLYVNRFAGIWSGFSSLGGAATADPAVAADATGFSVFVRGRDNGIYHCRIPNAGPPGPFVPLGGGVSSDPSAASDANGVHVVVRGNDNAVWHRTPTTPWSSLGGGASADPVAIADGGGGDTHVLVRGMDGRIYHATLATGGWQPLFGNTAPVRAGR